jgi:hypothetical protein
MTMTKAKTSAKKTSTKRTATKRARAAKATGPTYYKVLRNGRSWHGGEWEWSLPTPDGKGGYTPGEWRDAGEPVLCTSGLHLTSKPGAWWGDGATAFVAEYDGRTDGPGSSDKIAVERCRLLRPATHEELALTGLYLSGEHHASDSATVHAYDSATVRAYGSATVHAYGSATVRASRQQQAKHS